MLVRSGQSMESLSLQGSNICDVDNNNTIVDKNVGGGSRAFRQAEKATDWLQR